MHSNEPPDLPERLPVLPLRDVVVFPHVVIPLLVGRPASLSAVEAAVAGDRLILLVAQRVADVQDPAAADLYRVGVVARILQVNRLPSGTTKVLVEGVARARVTRYAPSGDALRAIVSAAPIEASPQDSEEQVRARQVIALFEEYVGMHRRIPNEVVSLVQGVETPARQAYVVAAHLGVRHELRQALKQAPDLGRALSRLTIGRGSPRVVSWS